GLAALTKLVFFLGLAALGGVTVLMLTRNVRRAAGLAAGVLVGMAILSAWEAVQFAALGTAHYADLKMDFYYMFVRESGALAWLSQGGKNLLDETATTAAINLKVIGVETGWALSLAIIALMAIVLVALVRQVAARHHTVVHVFLGLFFVSYVAWFFFTKHDPFYRFFVPVYLLFGIYLAFVLAEIRWAFARVSALQKVLLAAAVLAIVGILLVTPFVRNTI